MSAPIRLLVNPVAGGGRAGRAQDAVEDALRAHGFAVRVDPTRDLEHARELARCAAEAGETVVCLSGDGMVGAVADVLRAYPDSLLGVLPGGRGNDLARVLGIPLDPIDACATIAHGVPRVLDLGEVQGRAFVGIASVGFDSDCNRIANESPSWLGRFVYLYSALRTLIRWQPATFEIELDPPGERHSFSGYTVGACNSQTYGGGMRAAPDALLDDGLLDVVVLEDIGKLRFLARILPKVFGGTHVREPTVKCFRTRELLVSAERPFAMYADGEEIAALPVRVRALPGAVRVLLPAALPSSGALRSDGQHTAGLRSDGLRSDGLRSAGTPAGREG